MCIRAFKDFATLTIVFGVNNSAPIVSHPCNVVKTKCRPNIMCHFL